MYFVFIGVQTFAVTLLIIGFFLKAVARDPNVCDEKVSWFDNISFDREVNFILVQIVKLNKIVLNIETIKKYVFKA